MSITSVIESGVVINAVEECDTFDDIFDYVAQHVDAWVNRQVLWDMTLFNFQSIDSQSIRSFIQKGASLSEKRLGLKTAFLVDSDLAFGMMRMLQILAEESLKIEFGIFRSKDEALRWISE